MTVLADLSPIAFAALSSGALVVVFAAARLIEEWRR